MLEHKGVLKFNNSNSETDNETDTSGADLFFVPLTPFLSRFHLLNV